MMTVPLFFNFCFSLNISGIFFTSAILASEARVCATASASATLASAILTCACNTKYCSIS